MFLACGGTVVLNEGNTFPGLPSYSRYARMMASAGLSLGAVRDRLVASSLGSARVAADRRR